MEVSEEIERYLLVKATHASPRTIKTDSVLFRQFCRWLGSRPVDEVTFQEPQDPRTCSSRRRS
jgi:hypothetical protein